MSEICRKMSEKVGVACGGPIFCTKNKSRGAYCNSQFLLRKRRFSLRKPFFSRNFYFEKTPRFSWRPRFSLSGICYFYFISVMFFSLLKLYREKYRNICSCVEKTWVFSPQREENTWVFSWKPRFSLRREKIQVFSQEKNPYLEIREKTLVFLVLCKYAAVQFVLCPL